MNAAETTMVRFYFPVRDVYQGAVFIHYAYEKDGRRGVGMYEDRGEVLEFPLEAEAGAVVFCQHRNKKEGRLPVSLPTLAMEFFFRHSLSNGKP